VRRLALNQSCFPGLSTARFLEVAVAAGADSVELRAVGSAERREDVTAATRSCGLRVEAVNALMDWALVDDPDPRPALESLLALAVDVGAPVVVCVAPIRATPLPPLPQLEAAATERLASLTGLAATAGVRLALEPVGRSSTRPGAVSGIRRLSDALRIAEAAGAEVQLILDSYNIATAGESFAAIGHIPLARIALAQVADRDPSTWGRALPCEGDLELEHFSHALRARGYEGAVSVELFPAEPPNDPTAFARRALAAARCLEPLTTDRPRRTR